MSSLGQAAGGIVGGAIGFFLGGPAGALRGAQIGIMAGGLLDPPKGPVIRGPRLDDLSVQTATYGAFIPRAYGAVPVLGNVFWVQGDSLIEVQKTTTSGGKGGPVQTTQTFAYYATFAVGLCEGPIAGIRRIWIGGQLWYDAGSDDVAAILASNQSAATFTLYLGTDTQDPDPLIQADRGVANVSAHRGLAYLVFERLPLENYGNNLAGAQVKVEVLADLTSTPMLSEEGTLTETGFPIGNDYDGRYLYTCNQSTLRIYDMINPALPRRVGTLTVGAYDVSVAGDLAYLVAFSDTLRVIDISNPLGPVQIGSVSVAYKNFNSVAHYNTTVYCAGGDSKLYIFDVGDPTAPVAVTSGTLAAYYRMAVDGGILYALDGGTLYLYDLAVATSPTLVGSIACAYGYDLVLDGGYAYVACNGVGGGYFRIYDVSTPSAPALVSSTPNFSDPYTGVAVENGYAWLSGLNLGHLYAFDVRDPTAPVALIDTLGAANMRAVVKAADYILTADDYGIRSWVFSPAVVTSTAATLGDIVQAECLKSSLLEAADLDVTELTDSVRGYRVSALGAIRAGLDPLRAAWPFDVVQHGYRIRFKKRGSASVATITAGELDARAAGDAPGVAITDAREMDLMLPRKVSVQYLDATREYDTNAQYAERLNTDAVNETALDLPIVFNAEEAAGKAETLLYLYWLERYDVSLRLPPSYGHLEPGDVITVQATHATYELRLTSITYLADGRLECAAKYNSASLYTPAAQGEEGQGTGSTLGLSGPSHMALLDIPLLRDADDRPGYLVAMGGALTGWPGGILYRSDDDGATYADVIGFAPPGSTLGYATTALSAHAGTMYDMAGTLAVRLYQGSLASVSEAQLFAGQNWFAYGAHGRWEIIAARVATLQGDGSYVLRDFLRGQFGTEWATGLHATTDAIVLLDTSTLAFVNTVSSSIGTEKLYRAITVGKALDSATDEAFTYTGVNLECLSPVQLTGNRHPSTNDWTLTWVRRSRFAGWRDYVDAALGETSEAYEVEIYSSGTYTTLKRTLTGITSATAAYTSAQQVTDFGSNQSTLYLKIYQLSATVGRGYALTQSITR